jgi:hypothetical protein
VSEIIDIHPHIVSPDTKRYPLAPLGGTHRPTWLSSSRPVRRRRGAHVSDGSIEPPAPLGFGRQRNANRDPLDRRVVAARFSGDTLMVTRIDRLARSIRDLQTVVYDLKNRGIALKATEQPIDTSTVAGKAFLDMLGVFAEFETDLREEREVEGIAKAKLEGKYKGRKKRIDDANTASIAD